MKTELVPTGNDMIRREPEPIDPFAAMLEPGKIEELWRIATIFANSSLVPEHFRGKQEDCYIICQLSLRLRVDPFMLLQNTYVVHGRPGMEAKLAIALANARGCFKGPIQYDMSGEGDSRSCTAFAVHKSDGSRCEMTVSMATARAEGWTAKAGSKWKTIPDLMLRYRSASWLVRTYCPEVLVGLMTRDELEDIGPVATVEQPTGTRTEQLVAQLGATQPKTVDAKTADPKPEPEASDEGEALDFEALRKRVVDLMAEVTGAGSETKEALASAGIKSGLAVAKCTSSEALIQAADNLNELLVACQTA